MVNESYLPVNLPSSLSVVNPLYKPSRSIIDPLSTTNSSSTFPLKVNPPSLVIRYRLSTSERLINKEMKQNTDAAAGVKGSISSLRTVQALASDGTASASSSVPSASTNTTSLGYWIALHFSDQGTGAFCNLRSFLCLSSSVGRVRVVEPFLVGSDVGLDVSANWTREVPYTDVFHSGALRGYGSLVPFHTFLREAPRKLVVAQYKCIGLSLCRPCGHEDVLARGRKFSELNGFEMVGHVCLEYKTEGMMTVKEFTSQLYSTYNKSDVVVMFPLFGGLVNNRRKGYRLFMAPAKCQINNATICNISTIKPSQLVETSADNYIHKYLKGGSFITVMVRFETLLRPKNEIDLKMCLSHLYEKLVELKTQFGIESIVLCLDIGKYGSQYFRDNQKSMGPILPHVNRFISQSVKEGMTLSNWEDTFTNTSLRQNPGFVGLVQKTIATRGDVLVLLGKPSTFHSSTEKIFLRSHPEERVFNLENSC